MLFCDRLAVPVLLGSLVLLGLAFPLAAAPGQEAAAFYEEARIRFANDETEEAIIFLKNALQQEPNHLPSHLLLARIFLNQGLSEAAQTQLERAEQLGADRSFTVGLLAESLLQQRRYEDVIERIRPENFAGRVRQKLLVFVGRAYLELSEYDAATGAFTAAAVLDPKAPEPHAGLAKVLLHTRVPQAALDEAEKAVRLGPDHAESWNVRGSVSHAMGRLAEAAEFYGRVLELNPAHLDARVARAGVFIDLGEDVPAAEDIEFLRREFPLEPRAAYLEGVLNARAGNRSAARAAYEETSRIIGALEPGFLSSQSKLLLVAALASYDLRDYEQASIYLTQFLDLEPEHVGALKLLGTIQVAWKQYATAITTLEPALRGSPNDVRLLVLLSTAYMRAGYHELAAPLLKRAVDMTGGNPEIRTELAANLIASGEQTQGMEQLQAAYREDPELARAGMLLVGVHSRRGEHEEALRIANTLKDRDADSVAVLNLLGRAQLAAGLLEEARASFEAAISRRGDFLPSRINLAKVDLREGNPDLARTRLAAILELDPANIDAVLLLARVETRTGDVDDAIRLLQKSLTRDERGLPLMLALVELYIATSNRAGALQLSEEAETVAPNDLTVLSAVGISNLAAGDETSARAVFARMVSVAGFDEEALYRIAGYQRSAGDLDAAAYSLEKAATANPGSLKVRAALLEVYLESGKLDRAREQAEELVTQYPEEEVGHRLLAEVLTSGGDYAGAVVSYRAAFERAAGTVSVVRLSRAHSRAGDSARALEVLNEWLADHPTDHYVRNVLAETYLRLGNIDNAREEYERVTEGVPNQPQVLNNLAYIYDQQDDPRALEFAERANRLAPDDPAINDTFGWLLVRKGEPDRGLPYLRNAHARSTGDPEIRYHIAVALVQLDRPHEAIEELEVALGLGRPFKGMEHARELLERLN